MLPVSLPALHIFPFCNQLRPRFSRVSELILRQPVRTVVWRGRGAPWGVVHRVSSSRNPRCRKISKGKAALWQLAPSPRCLRRSGSGASKHQAFLGTPRNAVLGLSLRHGECLAFPVALVPPQQQKHVVKQSRHLRGRHWSLSSLAPFGPCWGEDDFIFGRHQLSSIVLAYPCYKTILGTHSCLVTGLRNPPATFVLQRDSNLPFVEQRCIASQELWQTNSIKLMNSLSPTQQAEHEHTLKAHVKESAWNKKETTDYGPWEIQTTPKARANGHFGHRRAYSESVPSILTLVSSTGFRNTVSLSVCVGSASGIGAGRRWELQEKESSEKSLC